MLPLKVSASELLHKKFSLAGQRQNSLRQVAEFISIGVLSSKISVHRYLHQVKICLFLRSKLSIIFRLSHIWCQEQNILEFGWD